MNEEQNNYKESSENKITEIYSPHILNFENTKQQSEETYAKHTEHPAKESGYFGETLRFFILAVLVVIPIRLLIIQPFIVSGISMDPTFAGGQYVIVDKISYRFNEPKRGDVIVLRYPVNPKTFFIKRIVGLPGETITLDKGVVSIKNKEVLDPFILDEPYIRYTKTNDKYINTALGNDEYFVMGDNRTSSLDSRSWGVLSRDLVVGQAMLRLFPVNTATFFPGFPE